MTSATKAAGPGYQGWRNYETWAVALWLDNEQTSYEHWREEARRCQREALTDQRVIDGVWTPKEAATFNLADQLREEIEAERPLTAPTMYTDLLLAAISEVDCQEIAKSILDGLGESTARQRDAHPRPLPFGRGEQVRENNMNSKPPFTEDDIVYCYTRAESIADGTLRDITEIAKQARFRFPIAITAAAWAAAIEPPDDSPEQSAEGRVWDVLQVLLVRLQQTGDTYRVDFLVHVKQSAHVFEDVALKALCHPGDEGEPVISIMLPNED